LAIAAYNAGPSRVNSWLEAFGDPRTGKVDWIDWIELIPVAETRNYVQRVTEGVALYRDHLGTISQASN
jgi:soluble lytic murein transglycosylase